MNHEKRLLTQFNQNQMMFAQGYLHEALQLEIT